MIARLGARLVIETPPRVLLKFLVNFGWKGMRAVRRFRRRRERGETFPAFLFLSVTDRCNLRCQGCWVSGCQPPRELDLETLDRIVSDSAREGTTTFGVLGGEPLLRHDLFELFEAHPDCYFILFTNGTLITDEVARRLRRAANVSPLISIEGREAVSDVRRGGSDVYARTIEGLTTCRRHGLITGVATSVCRSNIAELATDAFVHELVHLGVHYLWYYIYRPVGPNPAPELALSADQVLALRQFMVSIRERVPMMVVDSYWDHDGRALCPAAVGIGYHVGPAGDIEPCPVIQFARERLNGNGSVRDLFVNSAFLEEFRDLAARTTRGCILLEYPGVLGTAMREADAWDTSGRATAMAELEAMRSCASHHIPGREIPESYWPYRWAKKSWFFGMGAYG